MCEPVVVFWHCLQVPKSQKVAAMWNTVMFHMKMWYPDFRYVTITTRYMQDNVNTDDIPSSINACRRWFPLVMLVPGPVWNAALEDETVSVLQGAQIYNGVIIDDIPEYRPRWNDYDPETYKDWLIEAGNSYEFRKIQNTPYSNSVSWWQWVSSWVTKK